MIASECFWTDTMGEKCCDIIDSYSMFEQSESFHIFTVLSLLHVAKRPYSDMDAIELTQSEWPL